MLRQPLGTRFSTLADVVARALVVLLAAALIWYGLMAVLLAAKVDPDTVDAISGYRSVYEELSALESGDVDGDVRWIAAIAGLVAFVVFGWLALRMVPRPYVARSDLELESGERGTTEIGPRALERIAEVAALRGAAVSGAGARWRGERLELAVSVASARDLPQTLRDVRERVRQALSDQALPVVPVDVTLTGVEPRSPRRELS